MRDFSLLDSAIDEMERVLLGNKPREAEEIYLQNAIDFIERFIKQLIEESKLNENQQIVLDWLKENFNETEIKASCTGYLWKLHQSYIDDEADEAGIAYEELSYKEEAEMVRVFAEWFEQERK
ncbi:hypothetical protein QA5_00542 [Enterococcus faecalis EnGen0083]|uniref:hypothetical protein n=1 Tax=Enterococcus faecalis TaxID=1351 RepID=UPI00032DC7E7|nr:hypothetical protein [Enterococcus faecalis]DAU70152.1 MAG TPA: hypothetical protein [Caudoviricetes sp.]EOE02792.1 hypothetical protein Q9K_00400 [Enterococcus faecalis EnGen0075]EOE18007.1 hypothetical protein Q9W_00910 [Enterococcus faecalis EnGen0060]EOE25022.1 hypothetical protein QA5_00542 [Enterococcus faecalis EnGen0083]HBI1997690.1 hypothetical protein [Enterococcus faecalis]